MASVYLIIGFRNGRIADAKIKTNHLILCGDLVYVYAGGKGGPYADYKFEYKDVIFEHNTPCSRRTKNGFQNGRRKVLVLIEKDNPGNNRMIDTSEDYEKYNVTQIELDQVVCDDNF